MALIRAIVLALLLPRLAAAVELPVAAEAERVVVRAEPGLEELAARAAQRAPRALAAIEADLEGLPRVAVAEVRLVKHTEDIGAAAPPGRGAPAWATGTAYPDEGVVVVAIRGRDGALLDWERTLDHELAHLALDRALGGRVPRWLTEGFAYLHSSDVSLARATTLFGAVMSGRIRPLWELEQTFPAVEDEAELAYAQSYDFVSWLAWRGRWDDSRDDGDRTAFRQFLAELAAGRDIDGAAVAAFGRRLSDLETEWRASLRDRYLWVPLGAFGGFLWVVAALLLVIGWIRRRRRARRILAQWEIDEAAKRPN